MNPNSVAVDLSGWRLTGGIDMTFKEGVVIPAGGTLYVSPNVYDFRQRTTGPSGNQCLLVAGNYDGHLSKWGEAVQLLDLKDAVIATLTTPSNPSLAQQYLRITEVMYHPADPTKRQLYKRRFPVHRIEEHQHDANAEPQRRALHRRRDFRFHRQQRHQPCSRSESAGRLQPGGVPIALRNGL